MPKRLDVEQDLLRDDGHGFGVYPVFEDPVGVPLRRKRKLGKRAYRQSGLYIPGCSALLGPLRVSASP